MDAKTKTSIINSLRMFSLRWKPRYEAKKLRQIGPALFKCDNCNIGIYEGSKEIRIIELDFYSRTGLSHIILKKGKFEMDHNPECVPKEGFTTGLEIISSRKSYMFDWNIYLDRMFCLKESFQGLCSNCHKLKTYKE